MADIITTLHPVDDQDTNLYPNIKRDNIPNGAINRSKLNSDINGLLNNIGELHPSGTDTSTNILAFTSDKGIYIATDNGHWYYWNGTNYVDGGLYQTDVLNVEWESGTINYLGEDEETPPYNLTRRRTKGFISLKKGQFVTFGHTYKYDYNVMQYDEYESLINDSGWSSNAIWIAPYNVNIRLVVKYSDKYLNLINRAVAYWHRNDIYEEKAERIVFELKDVSPGDTITIKGTDNNRFANSEFNQPYGYYTSDNPPYIYDSGWIPSDGRVLTRTISGNAKSSIVIFSLANNSAITSRGYLLYPQIIVRKSNDENITTADTTELNNEGVIVNKIGSVNLLLNNKESKIIQWGHRGYMNVAPEDTLPSYEIAYKMGLRCIECDVRLTADNVPVILHDSTLNRTARNLDGSTLSSTIYVADVILPKLLNNYDFGVYFSNEFKGTKIPTLEELCQWCKAKNCYLNIDLLGGAIDTTAKLDILLDVISRTGMINNILWEVTTTTFVTYLQGKGISNDNIMYNPGDNYTTSIIDTIISLGLNKVSMRYGNTYGVVNYALSKKLSVYVWGLVNEDTIDNLMKYYNYGVSGFYVDVANVDLYFQDYQYVLSKRKDM